MAYWWYLPDPTYNGLGAGTADALALWKEIGLLGAEIKTAQPLLVTSHPVDLPMTPSANVWARALGVGTNSMILLAVNDNDTNDMAGCHYTPVTNATVTVTLPSWMQYPTAFEISASGLNAVTLQTNGNQLVVSLGTLDVTRMIVLTRDAQLQTAIQQRYTQLVQPGVCSIAPESCVNDPPGITQQPGSQFVLPGSAAAFSVVASGTSPLSYQWQKNSINLSDSGNYSGSTTAVLGVSGVDSTDIASYGCVVTNAYGSVTSSVATLTLVTNAFVLNTLAAMPTLSGDTNNEARAITPDGLWVVGISGTRGFLYNATNGSIYNVLDPFSAQSSMAVGVCYRTSGGQQQVIVGGMSAGWNADYCFTNGTAFAQVRRDNTYGSGGQNPEIGIANLRASGGGDVFWDGWGDIRHAPMSLWRSARYRARGRGRPRRWPPTKPPVRAPPPLQFTAFPAPAGPWGSRAAPRHITWWIGRARARRRPGPSTD